MSRRKSGAAAETAAPVTEARAQLPGHIGKLRQYCRQLFGIPDYDRYLAHWAEHHPGEKPLSRSEFFARSIDRKYSKSGPRCC